MSAPPDETLLLTVQETCEQLRLGKSNLFKLLGDGMLPSVKIGGSRRIRRADLEQFVRSLPDSRPGADEDD